MQKKEKEKEKKKEKDVVTKHSHDKRISYPRWEIITSENQTIVGLRNDICFHMFCIHPSNLHLSYDNKVTLAYFDKFQKMCWCASNQIFFVSCFLFCFVLCFLF